MQSKMLMLVAGTSLSLAASAFAQGGGTYSADTGFNIADASGDNRLTIGGFAMFRYNASFRDSDSVGDQDDLTVGFNTPVTRLRASGTVGDRNLSYKIQSTFGQDGVGAIDDAFAEYAFGNGWSVRWGQFNLPVVREIIVGAEDHLGADFSVTSQYFGQGYSQGIQLGYASDTFRFMGAFSDGASTANTNFDSVSGGGNFGEADYALSARGEFMLVGSDWARFNNYTSWQNSEDGALLGAAIHWQSGGETGGTADADVLLATVDFTWEGAGWNATAVGYYQNVDAGGSNDVTDLGFMAQGGIFVASQWELFGRYDGLFLDDDANSEDTLNFLTLGANYYLFQDSNAAKFVVSGIYAFEDTSGVLTGSSANDNGLLGDTEEGEIALTFQAQVRF
ncbi:MAG TPA: porin [Phycisphaerales bacterium]|nr:porin [Phycisphaerales bacterium]